MTQLFIDTGEIESSSPREILLVRTLFRVEGDLWRAGNIVGTTRGLGFASQPTDGAAHLKVLFISLKKPLTGLSQNWTCGHEASRHTSWKTQFWIHLTRNNYNKHRRYAVLIVAHVVGACFFVFLDLGIYNVRRPTFAQFRTFEAWIEAF